jgi:hypothetical protein
MKTTKAWGWLAAGVIAAGLNAAYHDGGLGWLHRVADRVCNSAAVLGLASGRAEQFLAEARVLTARYEVESGRLASAVAQVESGIARSEAGYGRVEDMTAREEAGWARMEADRAEMESQFATQAAQLRMVVSAVDSAHLNRTSVSVCPRVHVNVPRMPMIKIPAPVNHIGTLGTGPV